jgi:outer membrane protein assembly factor BamB
MRQSFVGKAAAAILLAGLIAFSATGAGRAQVNVTTYHNDNLRTGWNSNETTLTQNSFSSFGLLQTVSLDDQVDAQPLVVSGLTINGNQHNVVYVATEGNSVYAIDAQTGQVLLQTNLGAPVPYPLGCGNNGPNVGINSTPVIDTNIGNLYVIAYVLQNNVPSFYLHALSLTTLADTIAPVQITTEGKLNNGAKYQFNAHVSRQRAGLLLSNGNLYAGFASFCDFSANQSRGWVLGWQETTFAPLAKKKLDNRLATSPDQFFLTSVWMSGYGLAANNVGSIYFVTGNSDYSGTTLDKRFNITESAAEMSGDLSRLQSLFTPSNWSQLENYDADFGSGGLMLLPPQGGRFPDLAAAAGKDGNLYLMNADNLHRLFATYGIGSCWCGPSYYQGSDGIGRVVTSGGSSLGVWKVNTTGQPTLSRAHNDTNITNGQDGGFLTSISSNGMTAGSALVWAVGRPTDSNPAYVRLYAINPDNGQQLFSETAGQWPYTGGNANIVPVVANGLVYVASYQMLTIFGPGGHKATHLPPIHTVDMRKPLAPGEHEIYGIMRSIKRGSILIAKRNGAQLRIDASLAQKTFHFAEPAPGHALMARGTIDKSGVLEASAIFHAKDSAALWPADR